MDHGPFTSAYPPSSQGIAHFLPRVQDILAEHARSFKAAVTFAGPMEGMTAVYGHDPLGHIMEICEKDRGLTALYRTRQGNG